MDKQQRKAAVQQWKNSIRAELVAGMPLLPEQLNRLLDFLDLNLEQCNHTTRLTEVFLNDEQLEKDKVLSWLSEHGGYCDCEVLANLAEVNESLRAQSPDPRIIVRQKQNQTPRSLDTASGWILSKLPAPWCVGNLYSHNEPVQLVLGKKRGCTIVIVESPMPCGDRSTDEFWVRLWYDRTKLPPRRAVQATHNVLNLPHDFASTLVRSASWLPVYCWVVPTANLWHLEIRTELNRFAGDLPQISSLISSMACGHA